MGEPNANADTAAATALNDTMIAWALVLSLLRITVSLAFSGSLYVVDLLV